MNPLREIGANILLDGLMEAKYSSLHTLEILVIVVYF